MKYSKIISFENFYVYGMIKIVVHYDKEVIESVILKNLQLKPEQVTVYTKSVAKWQRCVPVLATGRRKLFVTLLFATN